MLAEVEKLLDEVRLLWHVMNESGERLHKGEPVNLGMRAVLELLLHKGPSTVPQVARSRHVTRQHVQTLVNGLLDLQMVELHSNPEHRRSSLVSLTSAGRKVIERMLDREQRFLGKLALPSKAAEMKRATETLRNLRVGLGGNP